jgi:FKBP-type peptidyl-prolyl cis-trans isomerase FkpA
VVDSSEKRGGPVTVMTAAVARCWAEGLQRLKVGGKARVTCPPWTAFGAEGAGPIPADATIVSELELVEVVKE